jgi:UDP-glucose 4-epimerase
MTDERLYFCRGFVQPAQSEIAGEIFNVGSGDTYSDNYLVSLPGGDVIHVPKTSQA